MLSAGSCGLVSRGCREEFVASTLTSAVPLTSCQSVMKSQRWVVRYIFSVLYTLHTVDFHNPLWLQMKRKGAKRQRATLMTEVEKKKKVKSMFRNRMKEKQRDIRGYFLCSLIEETFLEEPSEKLILFPPRANSLTPSCFLKEVIRQNTSSQQ